MRAEDRVEHAIDQTLHEAGFSEADAPYGLLNIFRVAALSAIRAAEQAAREDERKAFMKWSLEAFMLIDADLEMKAMKLLKAMAGELPGYRKDIDLYIRTEQQKTAAE